MFAWTLARACCESGDNELARKEFERVLCDNPLLKVRYAAERYRKGINARAKAYTPSTQWHLDLVAGDDSNPAAAIGAVFSKPLTPDLQIRLNGRLSHRGNPSTHFVDPSATEVCAGLPGTGARIWPASTLVQRPVCWTVRPTKLTTI